MYAAWKKKNERNEIVCFHCTQSDILFCSIARLSRGNKNKLRTFQSQKRKKIKNSQPQTKFIGSYKKRAYCVNVVNIKPIYLYIRGLFKNKIYYWDKIYLYFCCITQQNIKMRHVLGWSNKNCRSFLKYLVQNRGLHFQQVKVFNCSSCRR